MARNASGPIDKLASDARLEVRGVKKSFGRVAAIKDINFTINAREVVGLIGDNGAGKSTLVKIIAGVHQPDAGEIFLNGEAVDHPSPDVARRRGVETVFQDLALVDIFDVSENMFLGRELGFGGVLGRFRFLRNRNMKAKAMSAVQEMGIKIPGIASAKIADLSGGQRQAVAIARAVFWRSKLLLLDEPTAALGVAETNEVEMLVKRVKNAGEVATLIVSHDMPQVARMADKVVVMRQGHHVATVHGPDLDPNELVGYVTGATEPQAELVDRVRG